MLYDNIYWFQVNHLNIVNRSLRQQLGLDRRVVSDKIGELRLVNKHYF